MHESKLRDRSNDEAHDFESCHVERSDRVKLATVTARDISFLDSFSTSRAPMHKVHPKDTDLDGSGGCSTWAHPTQANSTKASGRVTQSTEKRFNLKTLKLSVANNRDS